MATQRGWWKLVIEGGFEPDDSDLEYISKMVRDGYNQGEIIHQEAEPYEPTTSGQD